MVRAPVRLLLCVATTAVTSCGHPPLSAVVRHHAQVERPTDLVAASSCSEPLTVRIQGGWGPRDGRQEFELNATWEGASVAAQPGSTVLVRRSWIGFIESRVQETALEFSPGDGGVLCGVLSGTVRVAFARPEQDWGLSGFGFDSAVLEMQRVPVLRRELPTSFDELRKLELESPDAGCNASENQGGR